MRCPHCTSDETEIVVTGKTQCWFCNNCGRTFTFEPKEKA